MLVRGLTLAAVALAVVAVGFVMFGGVRSYEVTLTIDNAGQLVTGNEVKVGGVPVGKVEEIQLTKDARARLRLSIHDDELAPFHRGTTATIRSTSLSGIANRYVAIAPGPNDAQVIPDGGQIPGEDTRVSVDLDQVLNSLDAATQRDLDRFIRASSKLTRGHEKEAGEGLRALNPALSQSAQTARELAGDRRALERFVVEAADVSSAVASRPSDLDQLVGNAASSIGALSRQDAALDSALRRLPPTLRSTNTTLVNLRSTLAALRPAVRRGQARRAAAVGRARAAPARGEGGQAAAPAPARDGGRAAARGAPAPAGRVRQRRARLRVHREGGRRRPPGRA